MVQFTITPAGDDQIIELHNIDDVAKYIENANSERVAFVIINFTDGSSIQYKHGDPLRDHTTVNVFTNDDTVKEVFTDTQQAQAFFTMWLQQLYATKG
jgi:ribosomal protein S4E